jgi:hypothetical protein
MPASGPVAAAVERRRDTNTKHEFAIHFRSGRTFYCSGFESVQSLAESLRRDISAESGGAWGSWEDAENAPHVELYISGRIAAWPIESIEDRRSEN